MTIPVECPDCDADLNIPDALAGKLVKCPHCDGAVRVPLDEPIRTRRPAPRPVKRRTKRKDNTGVIVGAAVGVVVVLVAAVAAVMLARAGKKNAPTPEVAQPSPAPQGVADVLPRVAGPVAIPIVTVPIGPVRPPLPAGWVDFRHPQGEYSVHVPRTPAPIPPKRDNIPGWSETGFFTSPTTLERPELLCGMVRGVYPPEVMEAYRTGNMDLSIVERMFPGMRMTTNRITWLGRIAIDSTFETDLGGMMGGLPGGAAFGQKLGQGGLKLPNGLPTKNTMYMRFVAVNDAVYAFTIHNMFGPPTEAERRAFFDSVVFGR